MILLPTSEISNQHKVTNISVTVLSSCRLTVQVCFRLRSWNHDFGTGTRLRSWNWVLSCTESTTCWGTKIHISLSGNVFAEDWRFGGGFCNLVETKITNSMIWWTNRRLRFSFRVKFDVIWNSFELLSCNFQTIAIFRLGRNSGPWIHASVLRKYKPSQLLRSAISKLQSEK